MRLMCRLHKLEEQSLKLTLTEVNLLSAVAHHDSVSLQVQKNLHEKLHEDDGMGVLLLSHCCLLQIIALLPRCSICLDWQTLANLFRFCHICAGKGRQPARVLCGSGRPAICAYSEDGEGCEVCNLCGPDKGRWRGRADNLGGRAGAGRPAQPDDKEPERSPAGAPSIIGQTAGLSGQPLHRLTCWSCCADW